MADETLITTADALETLCQSLLEASRIGLDTEFIPENTFLPELCLVQIATDDRVVAIDPLAGLDLQPLWEVFRQPSIELIVHAGAEELRFLRQATGGVAERVFDVQLAAGLIGFGYPQSLSNLVLRLMKVTLPTGETRTDWRRRPLTAKQLRYALDDVRYLLPMRDELQRRLDSQGRGGWLSEETKHQLSLYADVDQTLRWLRLPGLGGLTSRELAVAREVYQWRERRARAVNRPLRWILRDDLIVSIARRQPKSLDELNGIRGLGSVGNARVVEDLLSAIDRAMNLEPDDCPQRQRRQETHDDPTVLKMLSAAMSQLSQTSGIASTLLGTNDDLQQLLRWRTRGMPADDMPRLMRSWRRDVCGRYLVDVLDGKLVARVKFENRSHRLIFEQGECASDSNTAR